MDRQSSDDYAASQDAMSSFQRVRYVQEPDPRIYIQLDLETRGRDGQATIVVVRSTVSSAGCLDGDDYWYHAASRSPHGKGEESDEGTILNGCLPPYPASRTKS